VVLEAALQELSERLYESAMHPDQVSISSVDGQDPWVSTMIWAGPAEDSLGDSGKRLLLL
jgi:hypothetical protein